MDVHIAERLYCDYVTHVANIAYRIDKSAHFNPVSSNLLDHISTPTILVLEGELSLEMKNRFLHFSHAFERYLSLLDTFDEFKEKEFYTKKGYFDRVQLIPSKCPESGAYNYVAYSSMQLLGKEDL